MAPNELQVQSAHTPDLLQRINQQLQEAKTKGAHLLAPLTLQTIPDMHRPVVVSVQIDPEPKNKEVYPQRGGGLSLSALAFQKFADALGIQWDPKQCRRIDDGSDPNLVHYRMVGRIKALDGTWRVIMGDKEIRLETVIQELTDNYCDKAEAYKRDDPKFRQTFPTEEAVERWVQEKVRQDALQIKKHMLARAQTGAMARAVKSVGIRETYTKDELMRPFIFPKLVPDFDPNNPEDRAFLRAQAAGVTDLLFPASPAAAPGRAALPDPEPRPVEFHALPDLSAAGASVPAASGSAPMPTPAEQARADFQAADTAQQLKILSDLMARKQFKEKLKSEPKTWTATARLQFYDHLSALPDPGGPTTAPLPWE